jgi:hypothetical protein
MARESSLIGMKRANAQEHQAAKRTRYGNSTLGVQPGSSQKNKTTEDSEGGCPAQGLSRCQDTGSGQITSSRDDESFVRNVSPVDYLTLSELSGEGEFYESQADSVT